MNAEFVQKIKHLTEPTVQGSYSADDCIFLLKDLTGHIDAQEPEARQEAMHQGAHYSEMLPSEQYPSKDYLNLYTQAMKDLAPQLAQYVADLAELIVNERGEDVVLVSLARAGTPVGILLKRYLKDMYELDIPHYSISIIRGKGFDESAICYMINKHRTQNLLFVDGWTGKGAIQRVLTESVQQVNDKYGLALKDDLAVIADPADVAKISATKEDFFLPSSCLNSVVSGLVSRTIHRDDLIGEHDFHGAVVFNEWRERDLSNQFIDDITAYFGEVTPNVLVKEMPTWRGWHEMEIIQDRYGIQDINHVKPSVGETARVLLRRVPDRILIKDFSHPSVQHIVLLAKERNVPLEHYPNMSYLAIGLIQET